MRCSVNRFARFGLDSIGFQAMGEAAFIAKRFVITTVGDLKGADELFDHQNWVCVPKNPIRICSAEGIA